MGVDRTYYLFNGVDVGYDSVDYDLDEDVICGMPSAPFDMVYDGMSGNYAMAGKVIAKSDRYDGLEFQEITPDMLPDASDLKAKVEERFGPQEKPMKLYLFSHFH